MNEVNDNVWRPQKGPQTEVLSRSEREILYGGARFGGKSEAGLAWLCEDEYINNPAFYSLVIRHDYEDLANWLFRARRFFRGRGEVVGNPAIIRWRGGGITQTGHWKDKNSVHKYLGNEYQKILVEESTQCFSTMQEYEMLLGSLRSTTPGLVPQILMTTNPGGPGHTWHKKYFVEKAYNKCYWDPESGSSRIFIPSKFSDNKIGCGLDKQYVAWLNGLSSKLRAAWRDGSWDAFEGQMFPSVGMRELPFVIDPSDSVGRLFASLDIGIGHPTSFGLWWVDHQNNPHRLFTYKNVLRSHRAHAQEVYDKLQGFKWTRGMFPSVCWSSHDAWTKANLRDGWTYSPIDEYMDVFKEKGTQFVKANTDRKAGCMVMQEFFAEKDGQPTVRYWDEYNQTYVEDVTTVEFDKNDKDQYKKVAGDDTADECRYGLMGIATWRSGEIQKKLIASGASNEVIPFSIGTEYEEMFREVALA